MGAHTASGHLPGRTAATTVGIAAAVVTTAATGVLTGGTAFATDGHGGPGHSHGGDHSGSEQRSTQQVDEEQGSDSAHGFASQTLCDVLGDVDLGGSCSSGSSTGDQSSQRSSDQDGPVANDDSDHGGSPSGLLGSSFPGQSGGQTSSPQVHDAAPAPAPAPAPKPSSAVPDRPTVQPIAAQPSANKITPIGG